MGKHCENCYCTSKNPCSRGFRRECSFACGQTAVLLFIVLAVWIWVNAQSNNFRGWSSVEHYSFVPLLMFFVFCYLTVYFLKLYVLAEMLWSLICGLFECFWDFFLFLRRALRIPSWQNIRVRYSRQSALTHPDVDSDEESTPRSGFIVSTAASQPSQILTVDIEQAESSSAATSDRKQTDANPWSLQSCSGMQSASTSQNRSKRAIKKKDFKRKLAEVDKLITIEESRGESGSQELSEIEIPLSHLLMKPQSSGSTIRETSFCSDSDTTEEEEQALTSGIVEVECHEHASAAGVSGLPGQVRAADIKSPEKKQNSSVQPSAAGYVGFSALQSQARMSDVPGIQRMQEGREQISVATPSGLQRREQRSRIPVVVSPGLQRRAQRSRIPVVVSPGLQRPAQPSGIQIRKFGREQVPVASSSGLQSRAQTSAIQNMQKSREQTSAAASSGLQSPAQASDIQNMQRSREQIPIAPSSGLQRPAEPFYRQLRKMGWEQVPVASSSGLQSRAQTSDIQNTQKSQEQTSAAASSGLQSPAQASDIQNMQRCREQIPIAPSSGLQRPAEPFYLKVRKMGWEQVPVASFSGLQTRARTSAIQREEKRGENTSEDGHASTSGLVVRRKLTSTQETKINMPRRSGVQGKHEKDRSVQKSPKEDSLRASLEGAVGQQAQKSGAFSSLNLTGSNLIVSTHGGGAEADGAILSSGTDSSGSDIFFDQPMEVLDSSHIEVAVLENEEEAKDNDKKEDESEN